MQTNEAQMTAQQHAQRIAQMLQQVQHECRTDIGRVSDPKAQALFETIAEVLGGVMKALEHYQSGSESVWRSESGTSSSSEYPLEMTEMPKYQRPAPQGPQPPVTTDMAVDISENTPPPKLFTE